MRSKILAAIPGMIDVLKDEAKKKAEEAFEYMKKLVEAQDFSVSGTNEVQLYAADARASGNKFWTEAYDERLAELLRKEGIKLIKVKRNESMSNGAYVLLQL